MTGKRIILVDDEAYVTNTLSRKFLRAGHEVTTASNGAEAFELAVQNQPHVIVTDYQMPVLSGYEMAVKLKADPRTAHIPLVMLTARGHHLSPEQLILTNIKVLLPKPFSAIELAARVDEILAGASAPNAIGAAST